MATLTMLLCDRGNVLGEGHLRPGTRLSWQACRVWFVAHVGHLAGETCGAKKPQCKSKKGAAHDAFLHILKA
jgi:hypothetical protein